MTAAAAPSPAGEGAEPPAYAELHCLSNFSFLRGASHPHELVARAEALGYRALALTDECSVAGVVRAHVAARGRPLKLIVGAEFRLRCGLRFAALAIDRCGYGRLCRLITRGRRAAEKGTYALAREDLERSPLEQCFILWLPGTPPQPQELRYLAALFPAHLRIAVELLREGSDRERLAALQSLGESHGVPLVAAGDVHMHARGRRYLQDALTAIRLRVPITQVGSRLYVNGERYLRERERLARLYPRALLEATVQVAQACHFSLDELRYEYPRELVPEGESAASHLRKLTQAGARWRWPQGVPAAERVAIEHELELIAELSYEPYFLTVHDIVAFARRRGILCQGRGSAANSRVCYCLGITSVDPQRGAALLFERFISRERNEPPDIDVDFEHERREEVLQYVYAKYGRERAALAATVIMYRPRSALRDLGKVFGLSPAASGRLAKVMQWWDGSSAMAERVQADGFDLASPWLRRLLPLAQQLVAFPGFPRHLSQHVGGFVISAGPLEELVPIENAASPQRTVVQWDKDDLNDLGLLKVDLLALGMLTALRRAFSLVNDYRGAHYTLGELPAEDPQVYDMVCRADTVGVFQIESRAQMAMLPRLKPRCYYDLVIEVAIVRPGPIQGDMVHPYLRRRSGAEPIEYPGEEVREVLHRTLGVPIFQEQVMQIAIVAAGFTPGEADALRRAMGAWKRTGGLDPFRERLLEGMRAKGYPQEFAQRIYQQMLGFGEYGFPQCVVGETRVIDADSGRWVSIDEVVSGKSPLRHTLACDGDLRLRRRAVIAVRPSGIKPVWRLRTALGHTITATAEHPFLTMGGWCSLGKLRVGDCVAAARSLPVHGRGRMSRDIIPADVRAVIRRERERARLTCSEMGRVSGLAIREICSCGGRKIGFRRFVIGRLAAVLRSRELERLASSDIYWDRVVAIEKLGSEATYDLQIEGDHNFLANNLIVHNSHAMSFALLVYDSAWLKYHEPAAFTCALLNSQPMGFYAPAQLVRDARAHGVEVRAVDVCVSCWDSTLERCEDGSPALRLGLRLVKSLSEAGAQRLTDARRRQPFASVQDLAARAALDRGDLEALAAAGAFAALCGNRHLAFWEVAGTERALPLGLTDSRGGAVEGRPLLAAPTEGQGIVADYAALGLTLGRHPLALLRTRLRASALLSAGELKELGNRARVRTAGIVLMRQRPATASGVTFLTLEDESGQVNVIVWERVGREQRAALLESRLLEVHGELQRQEGVSHLIAHRLIDRTALLGELLTRSRDFH
ncbi:MAG TPA: error-prone DNA polymerase [Steroidobacteraceae bacterium]|nr:error-prone DNA polymerase [Steroidobacteraceae bacterium]